MLRQFLSNHPILTIRIPWETCEETFATFSSPYQHKYLLGILRWANTIYILKGRIMNFTHTIIRIIMFLLLTEHLHARPELEAVDGTISIKDYQGEFYQIRGDWKFSKGHRKKLTDEIFNKLESKNAYLGNFFFLNYWEGPSRGSFILKIISDKSYDFTGFSFGLAVRAEIRVQNRNRSKIVYSHPEFKKRDLSDSRQQIKYFSINVPLRKGSNFLILNYEQNYLIKSGKKMVSAGFDGGFSLGTKEDVQGLIFYEMVTLLIPLGIFLCLSVYSFLIYLSRKRNDKESLLLSMLNFSMFIKEFGSQAILSYFFDSNKFIQAFNGAVFFTPIVGTMISIMILNLSLKSKYLNKLTGICVINAVYTFIISGMIMFGNNVPNISQGIVISLAINSVLFFILFFPYSVFTVYKNRRSDLILYVVGLACMAAGMIFDFFKVTYAIDWPWMSMWGGTLFSIVLAKNNSQKFAEAYSRSEQLNRDLQIKNVEVQELNSSLEVKVHERTAEVRSLLQHIPQGILTIGIDGFIGPNYSAQLPDLLGVVEISGKSFRDLILEKSNLGMDRLDQAWQSILASIGESELNFEANLDKFPKEFTYRNSSEKDMVFKLTWNIETDEFDDVKKILVTILDATAEVEAQKKLDERNREFNIIRQLIEIGPKKSAQFFLSGDQLLFENDALISTGDVNIDSVKILFVNMHTLKGAARTLGLLELAEAFHVVESYYAQILRQGKRIDVERLVLEIKLAQKAYRNYKSTNNDVLGRGDDSGKIAIDRSFLEQSFKLLQHIQAGGSQTADIQDIIHNNRDQLINMIFMSLPTVLEEIMMLSAKIAHDLQKEEPNIIIDIDDILITYKQEMAIKNCFVHLLRNSLDHGIETAEERIAAGKQAAGSITLEAWEKDDVIEIRYEDDGAGLSIGNLREKGIQAGFINDQATPQQISNLIFHQGMSTAKTLSMISGRGVGMDAVRKFLEAEGGTVQVLLGEIVDVQNEKYRFQFRIVLPSSQSKVLSVS